MEEIAATFSAAGLPDDFHRGAEKIMSLLARSAFGSETRRTRDTTRGALATIAAVAKTISTHELDKEDDDHAPS